VFEELRARNYGNSGNKFKVKKKVYTGGEKGGGNTKYKKNVDNAPRKTKGLGVMMSLLEPLKKAKIRSGQPNRNH
jgi:hypothetical protein